MSGPHGKKAEILKMAAGFAVTVLIVALSAKDLGGLDPTRLFSMRINWWWTVASGLLFAGSTWFRGLCYPKGIDPALHALKAWRITAVGNAMNMLLPFKMGEGFRLALFPKGYSAFKRVQLTLVPAAADIGCILCGGIGAALFAGFGSPQVLRLLTTVTLIFTVVCVGAVLVALLVPKASAVARALPHRGLAGMCFWVAVSWALMLCSMFAALLATGLSWKLAPRAALFLFAALNFVSLIPSSPGALGIFEYTVAHSLQTMGISASDSLNAALLLHATQYLSLVPLGLVLWVAPAAVRHVKNVKSAFLGRRDLL